MSVRLTEIGGQNVPQPTNVNGTFSPAPGFGPPIECLLEIYAGGNSSNSTGPINPFAGTSPRNTNGTFIPPTFLENAEISRYFNDGGDTTTLNHTLWSGGIFPNATIADVMDIRGPFVCAEYL